jgi:RNA recognition motif-containing protein
LPVRLFVGNLPYSATESDLRAYFSAVAPPTHIAVPVDRDTGRPRGFAFVEYAEPAAAQEAIKRFHGQPFQGRPLSVSEARAREPGGPRPGGYGPRPPGGGFGGPRPAGGGFGGPRPGGGFGGPRSGGFGPRVDSGIPAPGGRGDRRREFGPDAKPKKTFQKEKPRGPIRERGGGRHYNIDDLVDEDQQEAAATTDFDDFATSSKSEPEDDKE